MEQTMNEHQLYVHISTEMMKVMLTEHMKNPGRGSLQSFLDSAIKDVDTIARAYVKVLSKGFTKDATRKGSEKPIEIPKTPEAVIQKMALDENDVGSLFGGE